ncbi:MAG: hypothetical protein HY560_12345 [Gemmatimonadetes bacterium]|nr:hypothetical protein [Gemmatimonadota bacterium]
MRRGWLVTLALAAGVALPQVVPAQAQDTRPGIAVFPFDPGASIGPNKEDIDALGVGLQQMLTTEFAANPGLRVVDRSQIRQLLAEQDLGATGRVDANTAAKVGKVVGARYVILGGFNDIYGDFRLDVRIVNVETSEIVKSEKITGKKEQLYSLVTNIAGQVTRGVNLPALTRQAMEMREKRNVPTEAVTYYSRALLYADRGNKERAAELFNRAIQVFPDYAEAKQGLQQLSQS